MKSKWIIFTVSIVIIAVNLLNTDFSVYQQLSPIDSLPIILITLVSILIKTGILSTLIVGIKNCLKGLDANKLPGIAIIAIPGQLFFNKTL